MWTFYNSFLYRSNGNDAIGDTKLSFMKHLLSLIEQMSA